MNYLIARGQDAVPIDWPDVLRFSDDPALVGRKPLDGRIKVSVVEPARVVTEKLSDGSIRQKTIPAVHRSDRDGKPRYGRRPFPDSRIRESVSYVVFHHSVARSTAAIENEEYEADRADDKTLVRRGLSVHFGVDDDGVVHQLLDLDWRDRSSEAANDRGVGVEVANVCEPYGAYTWEKPPPGYDGRQIVIGVANGRVRHQFAYTRRQTDACAALAAALCAYYPRMAPRAPEGLDNDRAAKVLRGTCYGIIGHVHVTHGEGKWDPGPAFDFRTCVAAARVAVARWCLTRVNARDVLALQRGLQVVGYELPSFGSDGGMGDETKEAIRQYAVPRAIEWQNVEAVWASLAADLAAVVVESIHG